MGIIKTINDLIEGMKIDNPIELSDYLEAKDIPHIYCWNSGAAVICFDSIRENQNCYFPLKLEMTSHLA